MFNLSKLWGSLQNRPPDLFSWYDFTKMIAEYAGNSACNILPCHSDEFPSPVKRPAYSVHDKTKMKETFGIKIRFWAEALKECLMHITTHN